MVFRSLVLIYFISLTVLSQTSINGIVTDLKLIPLQGATVVITKENEETILAYAITDNSGKYSINLSTTSGKLFIKASFIGYSKQSKIISDNKQIIDFALSESSEKLKEIVIKNKPIIQKGDTLSYSVSLFKDQKDQVIADVLKRMPGIEVLNDGKILYQGKPIQKYYIEGLDLLEGKYNLANENLPANVVSKVQILENHQPIKLLDSLVYSDKTSLNIKLKNNITLTGTSRIGFGTSPFLWDVNITPMLFTKKQQMISSYQTNNTGNDISTQIKNLTLEELFEKLEFDSDKKNWATINELSEPRFSKERWLNNNVHLLSNNYLIRLKKDVDLKINLSYLNDYQQQIGATQTTFFTPTETVNLTEKTTNKLYFNSLDSKFVLTKNTAKNYFKNTLDFKKYWDFQIGSTNLNSQSFTQKAEIPYTSFNNKLKVIAPFGKQIFTFNSTVNYSTSNQTFSFNQSQFENLLNADEPYDELNQVVKHSNFYTNNSLSFTKGFKNLTLITKGGFTIHNQELDSRILITDDTPNVLNTNELTFDKSVIFTELKTQYKINDWRIDLDIPLSFQSFNRLDNLLKSKENLRRLTFEPKLSVRKDINNYWRATASTKVKNSFGEINQLYYGYILNSYRNIRRFENPIQQNNTVKSLFGLSYRNPLKSLFFNGFYSYTNIYQNLILFNEIDTNGANNFSLLEQNNTKHKHSINVRGNKYFNKIKTTIGLGASSSIINENQILNSSLTDVKSKSLELNSKLETELFDWFSIENKNRIAITNIQFNNQQSFDHIINQEHFVNLNFYPTSSQFMVVDLEYYKNIFIGHTKENYFLNLTYGTSFKKGKIELESSLNNLLNTKRFISLFNNNFSYTTSSYELRPRQILIKLKFNF
ncbi:hypothetical protein BTO06_17395 [Tenacibaculum sp. SZ-18]|uniref:carboxypeptidase-like regulatory domain-containing protein n=1 Tax=Tenacibaculum sp. SZ-18 TaxID=754423 RepID=UPI000C2CEC3C|nr:carboxypeptidase-like regulatory domain-containing protein [Tenacibaculum sp. SZ-18]AUC16808.1 hypothetical protein BTO06_17395 [Tenacibaculum sp. SZ-18]